MTASEPSVLSFEVGKSYWTSDRLHGFRVRSVTCTRRDDGTNRVTLQFTDGKKRSYRPLGGISTNESINLSMHEYVTAGDAKED